MSKISKLRKMKDSLKSKKKSSLYDRLKQLEAGSKKKKKKEKKEDSYELNCDDLTDKSLKRICKSMISDKAKSKLSEFIVETGKQSKKQQKEYLSKLQDMLRKGMSTRAYKKSKAGGAIYADEGFVRGLQKSLLRSDPNYNEKQKKYLARINHIMKQVVDRQYLEDVHDVEGLTEYRHLMKMKRKGGKKYKGGQSKQELANLLALLKGAVPQEKNEEPLYSGEKSMNRLLELIKRGETGGARRKRKAPAKKAKRKMKAPLPSSALKRLLGMGKKKKGAKKGAKKMGAKKRAMMNPWLKHVADVRRAHPGLSYKEALMMAKKSY